MAYPLDNLGGYGEAVVKAASLGGMDKLLSQHSLKGGIVGVAATAAVGAFALGIREFQHHREKADAVKEATLEAQPVVTLMRPLPVSETTTLTPEDRIILIALGPKTVILRAGDEDYEVERSAFDSSTTTGV